MLVTKSNSPPFNLPLAFRQRSSSSEMNANAVASARAGACSPPSSQIERIRSICDFILTNARNEDALKAARLCQANSHRLEDLEQITKLDISARQLKTLPDGIVLLKNVSKLNAIANELTTLPDNLDELEALITLELNGNKFEVFPAVLSKQFKSLGAVYLANNPLHQLPVSAEKIIAYPLPNFVTWI